MGECPGEPGRAAGSALLVPATEPLSHATALLQVNRRRRVVLGPRGLHGHSCPQSALPLRGAGLGVSFQARRLCFKEAVVLESLLRFSARLYQSEPQFPHLASEGFRVVL